MKTKMILTAFLLLSATAKADQPQLDCAGGEARAVEKSVTGTFGQTFDQGLFLFVGGSLARDLQDKGLYPVEAAPGSNVQGLYWNEATRFADGSFGASVRIANGNGPFFDYYLKPDADGTATLEVWRLRHFRALQDGVGPGAELAYREQLRCR